MDGSASKRVRVSSSNNDAFFTLWFHSIKLCPPRADVCGDNQGTTDKEKAENISIGRADIEEDIGGVDVEKNSSICGVNKSGKGRVNKLGIGKVDESGIGGADKPGTSRGRADKPGTDEVDKSDTGKADKSGRSRVDKLGIGGVVKSGIGGTNKLSTDGADKPDTGRVDKVERQLARRQLTAQVSLLSFYKILFFYFFFLRSETYGLLSCFFSSSSLSSITSIKQDSLSFK